MNKILIYFYTVMIISLILAVLEIFFEKDKGWGSGWNKNHWYAKQFRPNSKIVKSVVKIINIESPLNYHALLFGLLVPVLMAYIYFYFVDSIILMFAIYTGVLVFEDIFWFLLNWNFRSFKELTKGPGGEIWWHKSWFKISKIYYIPSSYLIGVGTSLAFLLIATIFNL